MIGIFGNNTVDLRLQVSSEACVLRYIQINVALKACLDI